MDLRDVLIRTGLGEAGGEGSDGLLAVLHTIQNRSKDSKKRWATDMGQVALEPQQFSAWNQGAGGNNPGGINADGDAYKRAGLVVDAFLKGDTQDPTGGATHYYSPKGMQQLVSSGAQSNLTPRWFDQETQNRGANPVTIGGHIFTGSAGLPQGIMSSKSPAGLPPEDEVTTSALPGESLDPTYAMQQADRAYQESLRYKGDPMDSPIFQPTYYYPPGQSSGGGSGGASASPDPGAVAAASGPVPEPTLDQSKESILPGWMQPPEWLNEKRGDALLAIGTGILSGNNWQEGIAAAGQNLMKTNADSRGRELMQRKLDTSMKEEARGPVQRWQRLGPVRMPDGSYRSDVSYNDITNTYVGGDGKPVDMAGVNEANNSHATGQGGMPASSAAKKTQEELSRDYNKFHMLEDTYDKIDQTPGGLSGFVDGLSSNLKSMLGRGLDETELNRAIISGNLTGLSGMIREDVNGPGAMSEADTARLIGYLGGDWKSILSNPDVFKARLEQVITEGQRNYDLRYAQFNKQAEANPQYGYVVPERYVFRRKYGETSAPSAATPESTAKAPSVESLLDKYK